eukprot:CAMPEP_0184293230 /NCGR_PEP_ID=MMETSP1049-20130417/4744_1 /TAXON_ID=77928 /ORGANISM="Proteomonas sulcata, Strain CCMP704" /LENGTH=140 /DNA_ID=CAMNT_0026601179 /DNA_START=1 /DNA_END=423 /DNA_ORIENTATION=-
MAQGYSIGLNEVKFGLMPPIWFLPTATNVLGHASAERLCTTGVLLEASQAQSIGLVDEVVKEDEVLEVAEKELLSVLGTTNASARGMSKQAFRLDAVDSLAKDADVDAEMFCSLALSDPIQASLHQYMEALKAKSKGKGA